MTFEFSWAVLVQFVLATVLPLAVAVVTTRAQSGRVRGVLLAVLTLATTLLTTLLHALTTGEAVEWFSVVLTAVGSFIVSVGFHFGLWGANGPVRDPATGERAPSVSAYLIENVGRKGTYRRAA